MKRLGYLKYCFQSVWTEEDGNVIHVHHLDSTLLNCMGNFLKKTSVYLLQVWYGCQQALLLPCNIFNVYNNRHAKAISWQSIKYNICSEAALISITGKYTYPKMIELYNLQDGNLRQVLEVMYLVVQLRILLRMFLYNLAYDLNALALNIPYQHDKLKPCLCRSNVFKQDTLFRFLYDFVNLAAIYIVHHVPVVGKYLADICRFLLYGQKFVGYQLSHAGLCDKHKDAYLFRHNAYCLGFGIMFFLFVKGGLCLLKTPSWRDNFVLEYLIFSTLQTNFILFMKKSDILCNVKQEVSVDVFYPMKVTTACITKRVIGYILFSFCSDKKEINFVSRLSRLLHSYSINLLKNILVEPQLHSVNSLLQEPAFKLLIQTHGEKILLNLTLISNCRKWGNVLGVALYISDYIPNFILDKNKIAIVKILNRKETGDLVEYLINLIAKSQKELLSEKVTVKLFSKGKSINKNIREDYFARCIDTTKDARLHRGNVIENYFTPYYVSRHQRFPGKYTAICKKSNIQTLAIAP